MLFIINYLKQQIILAKPQDNSGLALQRHENSRDAVLPPTTLCRTSDLRQLSMKLNVLQTVVTKIINL